MTNREIARILFEMSALLEMEGIAFKPRVYEKAALGVESLNDEAQILYAEGGLGRLEKIPGVGRGIAQHIEGLLKKGTFEEYQELKKKVPVNIMELMAIEGVGPRMIKVLWEELSIKNIHQLEVAVKARKLRKLKHFGEKSEQKILKGIEFLKKSAGTQVLGFILPEIRAMESMIKSFPEVEDAMIAGSVRRRKETIGDIDILAISREPKKVMEQFVKLSFIAHVYGRGITKTNVRLKNGLDADLRVVPKESYGAGINYFTGSKDHNVALRELAIKKGYKLNEYGLFSAKGGSAFGGKGKKQIAGKKEEDIYRLLGMKEMPPPEIRENLGEIEAARENQLPNLIAYGDMKGDLQVQTNWTDGEHTIEEMAAAAKKAGLEYIAITDHTRSLAMTGGSDEKKLRKQMAAIDVLNKKSKDSDFVILKGAEVNIGKDGSLDIADEVLRELDVVGAAVHSHFNLSREEQTRRIIRAMENPHVDIIFHLTTRVINKREPIELDIDAIIAAAKRTHTVLEIDAFPDRLDIKDDYIRKCVNAGVKMSIDSDAHAIQHFKYLEIGLSQARRGWAEKKDIVNAWPVKKMLSLLK